MMGNLAKVAIFGSLGAIATMSALQSIGSGLETEFAAEAATAGEGLPEDSSAVAAGARPSLIEESKPASSTRGSTMLEQAILDAFPLSAPSSAEEKQRASNAADYVAASINRKGYLCAKAVEMRQAAPGQYGIGCVAHRNSVGAAVYLVDSRTGNVTQI